MKLTSVSIEGKQLNLCRGNIIFCHGIPFAYREKRKMKRELFSDSYTEATPSAISHFATDFHLKSSVSEKVGRE